MTVNTMLVIIFCSIHTRIIKAGSIHTTIENQYRNQTIQCGDNEECVVDCRNMSACRHSIIHCPSAYPCSVKCSDSFACANVIIHAQDSSYFRLVDCAEGSWTCIGITIYFPPNNKGVPISHILGADVGLSAGGNGRFPLQFYAINGWKDLNITTSPLFDFHMYHMGVMHCKQDYSAQCNFANNSWSCVDPNDICNDPLNPMPSTAPTDSPTSVTSQPTDSTIGPTVAPTKGPIIASSTNPSLHPTNLPTIVPTANPTLSTSAPTKPPTNIPTNNPTLVPTNNPTSLTVAPTMTPTHKPTAMPSTQPTKNPTLVPTNNPTASTVAPTINPTHNPTLPTVAPSTLPTDSPTLLPSLSPSVSVPTTQPTSVPSANPAQPWICDTKCMDEAHSIQIKVVYSFAKYIVYDLTEIECFLYKIFFEWLQKYEFIRSFEPCDIHIIGKQGGEEDDQFCEQPPCLATYSNLESNKVNRRLLKTDGNSTMTMVTRDSEITNVLESLSLDAAQQEFEAQYLHHFALAISVEIEVEQQNDIQQLNTFMGLDFLWYIFIGLVAILCCVGCVVIYQCIHGIHRRKGTDNDQVEGRAPRLSSTNFEYNGAPESTRIDYVGSAELHSLKTEKEPKRKDTPSLELTVNQIHRSLKLPNKRLAPKQSDGDETNIDNAIHMMVDKRMAPVIKQSISRSESQYPDLPPDRFNPYTQSNPAPNMISNVDVPNVPWANNAGATGADVGSPYDSNPYSKYLQPEMANFYNQQYNQSLLRMMGAQGSGTIKPIDEDEESDDDESDTAEDDDHGNNNIAPLIPNPVSHNIAMPQYKRQMTEETTGSSWKTTHDERSPELPPRDNVDPNRKKAEIQPGHAENNNNDALAHGHYYNDDDVVIDDQLHQMIMSATPIGADGHNILPTADGDILEDVAQFLEFEKIPNDEEISHPLNKIPNSEATLLMHNNSNSLIKSGVAPIVSPVERSHSKLTSITESRDFAEESVRLGMIDEKMIVSDYGTSVSGLFGRYSKQRDNTQEFKDKLSANCHESHDIMHNVVESIAGKEAEDDDDDYDD